MPSDTTPSATIASPRKSIAAEFLLLLTLPIDPYPSNLTLALCTLPPLPLLPLLPLPPAAAGRRVAALRGRLALAALAGLRDTESDADADAEAARVGDVAVVWGFRERSKDKKPKLKIWVFNRKSHIGGGCGGGAE